MRTATITLDDPAFIRRTTSALLDLGANAEIFVDDLDGDGVAIRATFTKPITDTAIRDVFAGVEGVAEVVLHPAIRSDRVPHRPRSAKAVAETARSGYR
ncbi:MAG: hypothetical protein ACREXT_06325 [Gammaproteobacteria bacterium]